MRGKGEKMNVRIRLMTLSPVSPASSTSTVVFESSDNLDASTRPAVPPPAMIKS